MKRTENGDGILKVMVYLDFDCALCEGSVESNGHETKKQALEHLGRWVLSAMVKRGSVASVRGWPKGRGS